MTVNFACNHGWCSHHVQLSHSDLINFIVSNLLQFKLESLLTIVKFVSVLGIWYHFKFIR